MHTHVHTHTRTHTHRIHAYPQRRVPTPERTPTSSRIVASIMLSGSILLVMSPLVSDPLTYLRFFIFAQVGETKYT
jgi:hypothetical protein